MALAQRGNCLYFIKKEFTEGKHLFDTNAASQLGAFLIITEIILVGVLLARCLRYGREYDRYLKRMYPDVAEQIRRNSPSYIFKFLSINPFFSISIMEGSAVRDNKLRVLRRKAMFYLFSSILVGMSFSTLFLLLHKLSAQR